VQSVNLSVSHEAHTRVPEKRGAVGLLVEDTNEYISVTMLALLTIQKFRFLLIEQPFARIDRKHKFASSIGNLAEAIWSRSTGVLKPDGLLAYITKHIPPGASTNNGHPDRFMEFMFDRLNQEMLERWENLSSYLSEIFETKICAKGVC
jgi:hypothetical protein